MKAIVLILIAALIGCTISSASQLVWSANNPAEGVTGYVIYSAAPGSSNYVAIGTSSTTNYNIGRPAFGTTFYVTAVNAQEESDPSNIATNIFPGSPVIKIKK